jgi:AcrR family transcriptional regulator
MSSVAAVSIARAPKRQRGRERVAQLLQAAAAVFAEKGYQAATMTEIALRAGAPIGSLYQFFPDKGVLADTLVQNYVRLLSDGLSALESRAQDTPISALIESLFDLLRGHSRERSAALPLVEARMDAQTRRATFRLMLRQRIAAILRAHARALPANEARDMAIVMLQLMKAASMLSDEEGLPGRSAGLRDLKGLAVQYLQARLRPPNS